MTADTEMRADENNKLHNAMTNWMVQLVVASGNEREPVGDNRENDDSRDSDFARLHRALVDFNVGVMKDSASVDTSSPSGEDLRKVVLDVCDSWLAVARRLSEQEKQSFANVLDEPTPAPPFVEPVTAARGDVPDALSTDLIAATGIANLASAPVR